MLKNKLDYKLVNLALVAITIYFIYHTGNLWIGVTNKLVKIIIPFLFAFAAAYALYPFLEKMKKKKVPKGVGVLLIVLGILAIMAFVIYMVSSVLIGELANFFDGILDFVKNMSNMEIDLNVSGLQDSLNNIFHNILSNVGTYVSNGTINLINTSLSLLSKFFVGFAAFIYFLIDMDKIRGGIKKFLKNRNKRAYLYVAELDNQMKRYLSGLVKVIIISFFEYTIAYTIIGHPYALLLGFIAGIANLIPYFGGIGNNILASITAFVVSPVLFIKTLITFFICSTLDSYVINPAVYGKTNSIHPVIVILSLFAGGIIFGLMGVVISFPLAIIIVTTFRFFKDDIIKKTNNIKSKTK